MFLDPTAIGADPIWRGLKVGDWATWVAGGTTFLAVCVAVIVPIVQGSAHRRELLKQEQARQLERYNQEAKTAHILAIEMNVVFNRLRSQMLDCRPLIQAAISGSHDGNPAVFASLAKLWSVDELPRGGDLQGLPYPVAPSIAALRSTLIMYNGIIDRAFSLIPTVPLRQSVEQLKIEKVLDTAQASLARAAGHLGKYEPAYGYVDYLDAGNGNTLAPLPDYE